METTTLKILGVPQFVSVDEFTRLFAQMDGCQRSDLVQAQTGELVGFVEFRDKQTAASARNMYHGWQGWSTNGLQIEFSATSPTVNKRPRDSSDVGGASAAYKQPRQTGNPGATGSQLQSGLMPGSGQVQGITNGVQGYVMQAGQQQAAGTASTTLDDNALAGAINALQSGNIGQYTLTSQQQPGNAAPLNTNPTTYSTAYTLNTSSALPATHAATYQPSSTAYQPGAGTQAYTGYQTAHQGTGTNAMGMDQRAVGGMQGLQPSPGLQASPSQGQPQGQAGQGQVQAQAPGQQGYLVDGAAMQAYQASMKTMQGATAGAAPQQWSTVGPVQGSGTGVSVAAGVGDGTASMANLANILQTVSSAQNTWGMTSGMVGGSSQQATQQPQQQMQQGQQQMQQPQQQLVPQQAQMAMGTSQQPQLANAASMMGGAPQQYGQQQYTQQAPVAVMQSATPQTQGGMMAQHVAQGGLQYVSMHQQPQQAQQGQLHQQAQPMGMMTTVVPGQATRMVVSGYGGQGVQANAQIPGGGVMQGMAGGGMAGVPGGGGMMMQRGTAMTSGNIMQMPQRSTGFSDGPMMSGTGVQGGGMGMEQQNQMMAGGAQVAQGFSGGFQSFAGNMAGSVNLDDLPPDACHTVYCDNLPLDTTKREIAHIFRPFGGFQMARVVTKGGQTFAFIDFIDTASATIAIKTLQSYVMDVDDPSSPVMRLSYARPPKASRGPPDRRGERGVDRRVDKDPRHDRMPDRGHDRGMDTKPRPRR